MAMVDADPYGIDILSVYKYGSGSMAHEERLIARRVRWAGVMVSELSRCVRVDALSVTECAYYGSRLGIEKDDLLPITEHDEKKVV